MNSHTFNQISEHVYWLSPDARTDRPILGAIAGDHATLIVDAGNSPAHAHILLREIAQAHLPPPAFVALTHWHWDHVCGRPRATQPGVATERLDRGNFMMQKP